MKKEQVLTSTEVLLVLLTPPRMLLFENLIEPNSASGISRRLGMTRQLVNYHMQHLYRVGLITPFDERRIGNCTEIRFRASAKSYSISQKVLGCLAAVASG